MTWLLTIIISAGGLNGRVIEQPVGLMISRNACEAAGVALVHMLIEGPMPLAATFRCDPPGVPS